MTSSEPVTIIAAMARNRVIGVDNRLPWHLPRDLEFFKNTTLGHTLIMGRLTWESLGKPLASRTHIVLSTQALQLPEGVRLAHSLDDALEAVPGDEIPFIAGGAEIYRLALPVARRMLLTLVQADIDGDTFFPEFDQDRWKLVGRREFPPDRSHAYGLSFLDYRRAGDESAGERE